MFAGVFDLLVVYPFIYARESRLFGLKGCCATLSAIEAVLLLIGFVGVCETLSA